MITFNLNQPCEQSVRVTRRSVSFRPVKHPSRHHGVKTRTYQVPEGELINNFLTRSITET